MTADLATAAVRRSLAAPATGRPGDAPVTADRTTATAHLPMTAPAPDQPGDAPVTIPRGPAREAAERELSRPEYAEHKPGLFRRTIDWIWDRLGDLLSATAAVTPGGWVGLAVICLMVVLLLIALRLRLGAFGAMPSTPAAPLLDHRPRRAAEHRAAAERYASEQRWSEALQERMRGIVRSLEERDLLDSRPGRTADEAAVEAGHTLPEHAAALRTAARMFDEVTYAGRPADAAAYARIRELDTVLRRSRPRSADPARSVP